RGSAFVFRFQCRILKRPHAKTGLAQSQQEGHCPQRASAHASASADLEWRLWCNALHLRCACRVSALKRLRDFVFPVRPAHHAPVAFAAELLGTLVRLAPEALIPGDVFTLASEPELALSGCDLLPEVEHGFTTMLPEEPRREAEAAVDPNHHARRLGGHLDQPLCHFVASPSGFQRDARTSRPHPRPDVPALPRRIDASGPVESNDALDLATGLFGCHPVL